MPSTADAPTAPGTPVATPISPTRVDLSWAPSTGVIGIAGYGVERCTGAGCTNFVQVEIALRDKLHRFRPQRHYHVRLSRARSQCGLNPQRVFEHRHRDDADAASPYRTRRGVRFQRGRGRNIRG